MKMKWFPKRMRAKTSSSPSSLVYLGLGSNLSDPRRQLRKALCVLSREFGTLRVAPLFVTEPDSKIDQPDFLNTVVELRCEHSPDDLLQFTQAMEARAGRTPGPRNGPRPLDIDLLIFRQVELTNLRLTIPHPRMHQRAFVLRPLAELAPTLYLPSGMTVLDCLEALESPLKLRRSSWNRASD